MTEKITSGHPIDSLFRESFNHFFEGLCRYAFTMVRDNTIAQDVVQSVFTKWWENQTQTKNKDEAKAYLYTAVYRTCLNHIRNDKLKIAHNQDYQYHTEKTIADTDEHVEFEELNEYLQEAIDELPPQCRIIFCKSRFEEKRYSEIADEMNLSIKTVEAQMGKALKLLRERLRIYIVNPN